MSLVHRPRERCPGQRTGPGSSGQLVAYAVAEAAVSRYVRRRML